VNRGLASVILTSLARLSGSSSMFSSIMSNRTWGTSYTEHTCLLSTKKLVELDALVGAKWRQARNASLSVDGK
jgi:hypothetical protein